VGRQAVEDDRALAAERQEPVVDPEAGEVGKPALALLVLAHARPDVGVEDVRALGAGARVVCELH
jgi:hypothetical protein